ncbi:MAG: GDSL-type esterase/lipase family protein [Gudongella sp.]|nr:GDSL-type esterase/lipase family protein [Gudongella sp.]
MIKKMGWPVFLIFTISLAFVFIVGFIISINISKSSDVNLEETILNVNKEDDINNQNSEESDEKSLNKIDISKIVIMGDSIGFGIGDEPNMGIGNRYKNLIDPDDLRGIELINISVPGYESIDLVTQIGKQENLDNILGSDLIIISIGGNDLNRLEDNGDLTFEIEYTDKLKAYKENLRYTIDKIREINQNVQLAIVGLYDPYRQEEPQNTRLLLQWNYETRLIVNSYSRIVYIPLYEKFEYHLDSYLSADRFHPSKNGYQIIAKEIYDILNQEKE